MTDVAANNKRIAKNTILLYIRSIIVICISLYTSRVILNALGVEDYGIYNAVGGVVAMFSLISGSLSNAISRFITYELGKGDISRLKSVFSASINIQVCLAAIIFVLGFLVGGWFLNTHMNIPDGRMTAANWVLVCSLLMFCINLISIPYSACIIAHERMSAFAYVSIVDAVLRLLVCYLIVISPFDRLISYSVLLVAVALIIRLIYGIYCSRNFEECHYESGHDRGLLKQMGGFAGWTFITNGCWMFNTQGVNLLINIFFGVTLNAARGIATQVDGAIQQFVNNFTTAVNPQITKYYAAGQKDEMFTLVCRGARFSYFLLLIFALPVMLEAEYILELWLKTVPDYSVAFLRLSIIGSMVNMLGNTGYTACLATGNVKRYSILISSVGVLVFPLTWIAFKLGFPAESTYIIFIIVYSCVEIVRLYIMKGLLGFPPVLFVKDVIVRIFAVTLTAVIAPLFVLYSLPDSSFWRLVTTVAVSSVSTAVSVYCLGLSPHERKGVVNRLKESLFKIYK